jgi:hypothetical protein
MQNDSALEFVVVGSGRSGTTYTAHIFTALGIPCGHEDVFNHHQNTLENLNSPAKGISREFVVGECSWSAVPFLGQFDGFVFHQRREPIKVLNSWLKNGLFSNPDLSDFQISALRFIDRFFTRETDTLRTVIRWIIEWNERCEPHADLSWNIECLDEETLANVTRLIGRPKTIEHCRAVLSMLPRNINSNGPPGELTWDDLPGDDCTHRLVELSRRYGYPVPR